MCSFSSQASKHRFRTGVAAVEMAMVDPVIFLLVFGSIEFARMMMVCQALTNAARDGCRNASLVTTQSNNKVEIAVRDTLLGVVANASATDAIRIDIDPTITALMPSGTTITATVEIDCSDVSWLPLVFTAGRSIRATSKMRRE